MRFDCAVYMPVDCEEAPTVSYIFCHVALGICRHHSWLLAKHTPTVFILDMKLTMDLKELADFKDLLEKDLKEFSSFKKFIQDAEQSLSRSCLLPQFE